jgi:hypothetical protein
MLLFEIHCQTVNVIISFKIFVVTKAIIMAWTSHPPQEREDPGSNPGRV